MWLEAGRSTATVFRWWDGCALVQQILTKARLGIKRVIERAHQHQHADALTTLNPTAFNQLVNGAAQGVAVYLVARGKLMLGGQIRHRSDNVDVAPAQVSRQFPDNALDNWSDV